MSTIRKNAGILLLGICLGASGMAVLLGLSYPDMIAALLVMVIAAVVLLLEGR